MLTPFRIQTVVKDLPAGLLLTGLLAAGLLLGRGAVQAQPTYPRGLKFDQAAYGRIPLKAPVMAKNLSEVPTRVSYERYVPSIGDQGAFSTCVGFASAYYYRTMVEAIRHKITDKGQINRLLYSPGHLYSLIKDPEDRACAGGALLEDAFQALQEKGVAALTQMPYPSCTQKNELIPTAASRIGSYQRLFHLEDKVDFKVQATKKALAEGYPLVISMSCPDSFSSVDQVWEPAPGEGVRGEGHAMCVVGYDDNKFGGAFRIVNSWTSNWADNGFCWVRYRDYGQFVWGAVQGVPLAAPKPAPEQVTLSGSAEFRLLDGAPVKVVRRTVNNGTDVESDPVAPAPATEQLVAYHLQEPQRSGTRYKFYVQANKAGYVYVLGSDLSHKVSVLFPFSSGFSPALGTNSKLLLPAETKNYQLDETKGTDYWLLLFSDKPLDITSYKSRLEQARGSFSDRVMSAFGAELVDPKLVAYAADKVGFNLQGNPKGSVVPLLVSLQHQ
jgi:hypothetical protein